MTERKKENNSQKSSNHQKIRYKTSISNEGYIKNTINNWPDWKRNAMQTPTFDSSQNTNQSSS